MVARSIRVELESALDLLKQGDLRQAHQDLQDLLQKELDNRDVLYALTGIRFWEDRMQRVHTISGGLSQGEYLVGQWGAFVAYMQNVVALSNLLCMHCAVVCSLTHCGFMGVLSPVMRASIPRKSIVRLGCAIKHWAITMLRVNALSLQSLWSQTLLQFLLNLLMHTLLREMSAGRRKSVV